MSKIIQPAVQIILVILIAVILGACAGPGSIARSEKTADQTAGWIILLIIAGGPCTSRASRLSRSRRACRYDRC